MNRSVEQRMIQLRPNKVQQELFDRTIQLRPNKVQQELQRFANDPVFHRLKIVVKSAFFRRSDWHYLQTFAEKVTEIEIESDPVAPSQHYYLTWNRGSSSDHAEILLSVLATLPNLVFLTDLDPFLSPRNTDEEDPAKLQPLKMAVRNNVAANKAYRADVETFALSFSFVFRPLRNLILLYTFYP